MVCLIIGGIIVGLILLFLATIFLVSLFETIHIYDLVPASAANVQGIPALAPTGGPMPLQYEQVESYLTSRCARAAQLGYVHGGDFREIKYPVRVSLWISADRTMIVQIAYGSTLKLPVKKTRVLSRLSNGRVLLTTDAPGTVDFTKLFSRQVVMDGDFDALLAKHATWLADAKQQGLVQPFEKDPFEESQAIAVEHAMRLEAFGYARFIDRAKGTYRYTLKGAFMNSTASMWIGAREARENA